MDPDVDGLWATWKVTDDISLKHVEGYKEMERYAKIDKEGGDHHLLYENGG
ncbi:MULTISPECIES: hypothetical protein [Streptomyces]|uniref:hypothetical protein n=1 Tax=Streptomyces TaxID=1883 RepID=UPI000A63A098|nr:MULTISPECIES: hypothetical protein [Streptomyces]RPK90190.1 hypothetical protein EES46_13650 [Streptomyces sp. ADI98-10]